MAALDPTAAELQGIARRLQCSCTPAEKLALGGRQFELGLELEKRRDREDASPVRGQRW